MKYIKTECLFQKIKLLFLLLLLYFGFTALIHVNLSHFAGTQIELFRKLFSMIRFYLGLTLCGYLFIMSHHLFDSDTKEVLWATLKLPKLVVMFLLIVVFLILVAPWLGMMCYSYHAPWYFCFESILLCLEIMMCYEALSLVMKSSFFSLISLILLLMFAYYFVSPDALYNFIYPNHLLTELTQSHYIFHIISLLLLLIINLFIERTEMISL